MSYSRRSPRLCEALTPTVMRHTGVEKSAEAIVVATRRRRAESAVRSRTWIAQTTGKKSEAGNRENLATKGGEVECRDMGARCQSGCDEKRTREHAERTALTRLSKKREKTPALPEFSLFSVSFASVFPLHQSSPSSIVLPSIFGGGCGGRRRPSCERTSATSFLGSP